jgi:membrane protease YdiL (CAAX protease family)
MRLLLGLFAVYALFQWSAHALGSDRGQAGLIVAVLVVGATVGVERLWFAQSLRAAMRAIGLSRPRAAGVVASAGISALLLFVIPLYGQLTDATATIRDGSLWLLPGLFAQGGVAEETLFRGYLFGHLRRGRSFRRAALLSTLPFVAVHLTLFVTLPWPVAMAALLLSVLLSFPLARLFELGGWTIWPPALVHFAVQGFVKIIDVTGDAASAFPLVWMAASAVIPLLVFLIPSPE